MTNEHPITPPPELVAKWASSMCGYYEAAQWGADQELEACCEWLSFYSAASDARDLRIARRPKPPSLKEQALADLDSMSIEPCLVNGIDANALVRAKYDNIRRALEALDD